MESVILQVRGLSKRFGGLIALENIDMDIFTSEIRGIIGPNGAGKTTLFNAISGFFPPTTGQVILKGDNITGLKAHDIAQRGMSRSFQSTTLFMDLSVLDNVFTGCHMRYKTPFWRRWFRTPSALSEEDDLRGEAMEVLSFMGLGSQKNELAKNLPHGHQMILSVCIALVTRPKLLLLDEPVTGMNQEEIEIIVELIRRIRDTGITIALVDHNVRTVMNLCDRITVLNYGRKLAEGTPEDIRENDLVIEAYLGRRGMQSDAA